MIGFAQVKNVSNITKHKYMCVHMCFEFILARSLQVGKKELCHIQRAMNLFEVQRFKI